MREFGDDNALYFEFGGVDGGVEYQDKDNYMKDVAKVIVSEFANNKALKASNVIRKKFNYDAVFKQMLLPLLHEQ